MRIFATLFFTLLFSLNTATAAPIDEAIKIYQSGDYASAYKAFKPLADAGNAEAQYYLGGLYADGLGVNQNNKKGLHWLETAVKNKHRGAAFFLSKMYLSGRGVPLDPKKGAYYLAVADKLKTDDDVDEECD